MHTILVVTGYSGAGKSVALKALEDAGYQVIDNMPLEALLSVTEALRGQNVALALGCDIRSFGFTPGRFFEALDELKARSGMACRLLFLASDSDTLMARFQETRRPHPFSPDRRIPDGIAAEIDFLAPLRESADEVLDTSLFSPRDLERHMLERFRRSEDGLRVQVLSFSYKAGIPREADLVFDVRFLRNPHYDAALRPKTGQEPEVGEYVAQDALFLPFLQQIQGIMALLLPRWREEGRRLLTVAFGCTGGKHRSVYLAEELGKHLENEGYVTSVRHRELKIG